jgi:predicted Zn-dependent protease
MYVMQGMSYKKDYNAFKSIFANSMNGFKSLSDPARINVTPEKVKVVQVLQTATLKDVLLFNKMPTARLEEFSILNGMTLTDNVPAGSLIKVVIK